MREFLNIHHKLNNGAIERKKLYSTVYELCLSIIKRGFPSDYGILCYNCNCSKGHRGYCPHEVSR